MTTSPAFNLGVRSIVTLHDLNFALRPEWYSPRFRAVYRVTALPGLRAADMVVAVSDHVREEALRCLRLRPEDTYRVYNGTNELRSDPAPEPQKTGTRYILSVGSLQPHKNLKRIVDAFLLVSEACPNLELWVVGRKQPRFRNNNEEENLLRHPKIRSLGYLPDAELYEIYVNAAAFCYPSIEEGFGLPILEAMQAGVPVVTSDRSCLPEIAGGAAELADPFSVSSIANALKKMLSLSLSERDRVVSTGAARAKQFSWHTSAEAYLQLYRKLLDD